MTFRLRAERLYFWPDPRNTTARQLGELLAGRDPATLTAEGFPGERRRPGAPRDRALALRRRRGGRVPPGARRRPASLRGAGDDHAEHRGHHRRRRREWTSATSRTDADRNGRTRKPGVRRPEGGNAGVPEEPSRGGRASRQLEARQASRDVPGHRPPHAHRGVAERPRAPGRTSQPCVCPGPLPGGRWIRPERLRPGGRAGPRDRRPDPPRLRRGIAAADKIPVSLDLAVKSQRARPAVERLLKDVRALRHLVAEQLTTALDLPLGFNALDGD